jgi:hypothetical protein
MPSRFHVGVTIFAVGTALCAWWAYAWAMPFLEWTGTGSGGIGAVSVGIDVRIAAFALILIPSLWTSVGLRKRSRARPLATVWWRVHLLVTIGLIGAIVAFSFAAFFPSAIAAAAVFVPVQLFFAIGALAIRVGSGRYVEVDSRDRS